MNSENKRICAGGALSSACFGASDRSVRDDTIRPIGRRFSSWSSTLRAPFVPGDPISDRLHETDDIAVSVLHRSDQVAAADIGRVLLQLPAGGNEVLDARLDIRDVPVRERAGHALGVPVRIEADIGSVNIEGNVIRLIHVWLHAEQIAVECFCTGQVLDRIDDRFETGCHEELLTLDVSHRPRFGRQYYDGLREGSVTDARK